MSISIHAPAWGATGNVFPKSFIREKFQSTLPHGERPSDPCICSYPLRISIHAPAWGATHGCRKLLNSDKHFNPRSRMGSDSELRRRCTNLSQFQSTLPHGERPLYAYFILCRLYFNPRSRMGSDSKNMRFLLCFCNFH